MLSRILAPLKAVDCIRGCRTLPRAPVAQGIRTELRERRQIGIWPRITSVPVKCRIIRGLSIVEAELEKYC